MANLRVSLRRKGASNFEGGDKFLPETDWAYILNKPATFVPDPHEHSISEITGLIDHLDSKASAMHTHLWDDIQNKPILATVATSGSYNDLSNKPTIPAIPSVMDTTEGNTGTATTQRTINALNLKSIILNHSPAGARPASDVHAWAKAENRPSYDLSQIAETTTYKRVTENEKIAWSFKADITDIEDKISAYDAEIKPLINGKLSSSLKGSANGLAELDANGKVPSTQLPSFVDDVLEYTNLASFPTTGESGKIYIDLTTNKTYRWGGTGYVVISETISLGETSSTAYRGDRGKIAYDHSQVAHAPSNAQKNSDITKAEIEAKLTGAITSHTHSQYLLTTGKAADSDKLDGLDLNSTTRNNEVNKVMRTDASGYANFGWINTTSGNTESAVTDVYVNTNDGYIRKKTLALFKTELGSMPASDVHGWAKEVNRPAYNLDQISDGTTYKRVTQTEKDGWNSKQNALGFTPESLGNKRSSIRTSGADNTSYVTELGIKTYVDGVASGIQTHSSNTSNPHGVTKAQVGLGSVLNYGIATQAQAEAGTSNTLYMSPLRTKQAIDAKGYSPTANIIKTSHTTLALTDVNKFIRFQGGAINVTVPPNSSVAFPIDTEIYLYRESTGAVTLVAGSGVTLQSVDNKKAISKQYQTVTLKKIETNTWVIVGAL